MARPLKQGLDYFPLDVDTDQDDKFQMIEAYHGIEGFAVVIKLMMRIYKEGYYYDWNEMQQVLFSRRVNVDINVVQAVVSDCIKYNIFNKDMLDKHDILTSKGIQKRYFEATTRRTVVEYEGKFILLSLESYKNVVNVDDKQELKGVNVDINPTSEGVNGVVNTQRKVKESKGEESKEKKASPKRVYDATSDEYILASFFLQEIRTNNPEHKEPNMQSWSDVFRKMIEIDGRDKIEITKVCRWVQKDDFEMVNVLSAKKLRERYDQLKMKMNKDKVKSVVGGSATTEERNDEYWSNLIKE